MWEPSVQGGFLFVGPVEPAAIDLKLSGGVLKKDDLSCAYNKIQISYHARIKRHVTIIIQIGRNCKTMESFAESLDSPARL